MNNKYFVELERNLHDQFSSVGFLNAPRGSFFVCVCVSVSVSVCICVCVCGGIVASA